jgi:ankyrin repeat protein
LLGREDVDVNAGDPFGRTALHWAAWYGQVAVVRELIARGADVNAKNKLSTTPLHEAAWRNHVNVVRELLGRGADANARDHGDKTPLDRAAIPAIRDLLRSNGAKTSVEIRSQ